MLTALIVFVLQTLAIYISTLTVLARTLPARPWTKRLAAAVLPPAWVCLAVVLVPSLFAVVFAVLLVIESVN